MFYNRGVRLLYSELATGFESTENIYIPTRTAEFQKDIVKVIKNTNIY